MKNIILLALATVYLNFKLLLATSLQDSLSEEEALCEMLKTVNNNKEA